MTTAIIGGSGFASLPDMQAAKHLDANTKYGAPSAPLMRGAFASREIIFLRRHGMRHTIAPHLVNYRANIRALKDAGARRVIAFAAVGGIGAAFPAGALALPDQILDYTHSRAQTFFDGDDGELRHIDFEPPFDETLRAQILRAAKRAGVDIAARATYAVMQGPRLETAAEINRLERDGADVVGMTAMPEAALARELELPYISLAMVINPAAGRGGENGMERAAMERHLQNCVARGVKIMRAFCEVCEK